MQTNKELIIEILKEQGWKKFYLGSPFEDGTEEEYSDIADKILFQLRQFGDILPPQLPQADVSGRSQQLPCDYRKPECSNTGEMVNGVWVCSNHHHGNCH